MGSEAPPSARALICANRAAVSIVAEAAFTATAASVPVTSRTADADDDDHLSLVLWSALPFPPTAVPRPLPRPRGGDLSAVTSEAYGTWSKPLPHVFAYNDDDGNNSSACQSNMDKETLRKQIENMRYQASMERWLVSQSIAA